MNPKEIIRRVEFLASERANQAQYWQDLANFCLPRKAYITTQRTKGEQLDFYRLFDSVAIRALQTMAAGFSSHLTNPSSRWFGLATQNRSLMEIQEVKQWFRKAEDEVYSTLNTSNFDSIMQEFYLDAGCFGTGVIFLEEDYKTRIRFTSIPIEEVYIEEDAQGRVNRVFRQFNYTAQQAWDRWGVRAGQTVTEAINKQNKEGFMKPVTFIHALYPRFERQAGKMDSVNMPWASVWVEKQKQHLVSEGGYNEMPYAVGRFNKKAGEAWGFSPAMNVLSDIKMINVEKKTIIRAAMKIVDPPLLMPSRGFILPFNLNPSAINMYNPASDPNAFKPIETRGNIPVGHEMVDRVKADIEDGFYVPLFRAFSQITKQMTIPEVQRRISENMVLLGPVVGRFQQEVFDPLITRVFLILARQGVFDPPPQSIIGQELDVLYISQLAKAQRLAEVVSIERTLDVVGAISQYIPSVLDKIDGDKAIDIIAEVNGVNPEILRDDKLVAAMREERRKLQEQQMQMEALGQGGKVIKDVADANQKLVAA